MKLKKMDFTTALVINIAMFIVACCGLYVFFIPVIINICIGIFYVLKDYNNNNITLKDYNSNDCNLKTYYNNTKVTIPRHIETNSEFHIYNNLPAMLVGSNIFIVPKYDLEYKIPNSFFIDMEASVHSMKNINENTISILIDNTSNTMLYFSAFMPATQEIFETFPKQFVKDGSTCSEINSIGNSKYFLLESDGQKTFHVYHNYNIYGIAFGSISDSNNTSFNEQKLTKSIISIIESLNIITYIELHQPKMKKLLGYTEQLLGKSQFLSNQDKRIIYSFFNIFNLTNKTTQTILKNLKRIFKKTLNTECLEIRDIALSAIEIIDSKI